MIFSKWVHFLHNKLQTSTFKVHYAKLDKGPLFWNKRLATGGFALKQVFQEYLHPGIQAMCSQVETKQPLNILTAPKGISAVKDLALSSHRKHSSWAYWFIQKLRRQRDKLPLVNIRPSGHIWYEVVNWLCTLHYTTWTPPLPACLSSPGPLCTCS